MSSEREVRRRGARSQRKKIAGLVLLGFMVQGSVTVGQDSGGTVIGRMSIAPEGEPQAELVMPGMGEEILLLPQTRAFDEGLRAVKGRWLPVVRAQEAAMQKARERFRTSRVGEERERATAALGTETRKLAEIGRDYEKALGAYLAALATRRIKADPEGKFRIEGVPEARYYVHGRFEILRMEHRYFWLVPVEVRSGQEVQVDLNRENATRSLD